MSRTSLALGNLRAVVILIVLAFHSMLAYLDALPAQPHRFDAPPYDWQSSPIIDRDRWFGFDLLCAWHDVYLMSLMFFLSGLFVWTSLTRKGSGPFLSDRLVRLGVPLVLAVYVLMPIALYPAYRMTALDPSVAAYWQQWMALPFWPCGPLWFLWELFALNVVAAVLHRVAPGTGGVLAQWAGAVRDQPGRFFLALVTASAIAYIPLALIHSPWSWFQYGPFAFQSSRPLHYAVYFFAGIAVGAYGIERGLLAADGVLARRWPVWLAVALVTFLLWIGPTALLMEPGRDAALGLHLAANLGFTLACAGGGIFVLAVALRFAAVRSRMLGSLSENAYGMYLIHYVFIVWLQYSLLTVAMPAVVKATLVFAGTLLLSWGATAAIRSMPLGARLIGTEQRLLAKP
jgi:hypothetical protein